MSTQLDNTKNELTFVESLLIDSHITKYINIKNKQSNIILYIFFLFAEQAEHPP